MKGHFERSKTTPKRKLVEFRQFEAEHKLGDVLTVSVFAEGDFLSTSLVRSAITSACCFFCAFFKRAKVGSSSSASSRRGMILYK